MTQPNECARGTRVMLVDDHPMWIDALAEDLTQIGCEIVAVAHNGQETLVRARATRPDVLVMDLKIPDPDGATCTQLLMNEFPELKVLVMSASAERDDVLRAVKCGASGYVLKSATKQELLDAVRKTAEGEAVFTATLAGLVLGEYRRMTRTSSPEDGAPTLTPREAEVLRLVAKGLSYRDIAEQLFVSHRTVQNHVQNVLRKLQLHNRVELTRYAIAQGFDT
ncbi:response regulator transcription factor [Brooklawnia cerclae]|uniref:DNA-binding NarL/FixJ family response regulator n=1 Tax=Brooklawnia cerclae TaxID=349934 RepID=A0ABX0SI16_9ACTN|nr:response regulator transcription factor [Brooklawnia cerclae]NIH57539.1 DNA-binding NarL/FixJ family response regulator [Brooklawnia cerclae]